MSEQVNVQDAKTRLSELLARVERGEEFTIARGGSPVARLSALRAAPYGSWALCQAATYI
ncbi:type II toxin-antitoxin system prevent-host-death family antitoxin [Cryobacterium algoritolerans]|uniref:Antitoxin n=1 Tax=Cryobacterium algoritolerans TaxID=1259184 RepID=A0A4R8WXM9_9MICO|nr:type II toxin-antitoxin system prevent-host-death family antitoxin [Cryobacterium algoritolerans]TFC17411.1 type II toxin-antitoxin system prevent-host-death family antitoxin [Cryobacterium algoritolerans]